MELNERISEISRENREKLAKSEEEIGRLRLEVKSYHKLEQTLEFYKQKVEDLKEENFKIHLEAKTTEISMESGKNVANCLAR